MGACAVSIKKKKFKERLAFKNKPWDSESQNFLANVSRGNFLPPVKQSQDGSASTLTWCVQINTLTKNQKMREEV